MFEAFIKHLFEGKKIRKPDKFWDFLNPDENLAICSSSLFRSPSGSACPSPNQVSRGIFAAADGLLDIIIDIGLLLSLVLGSIARIGLF
jgi:hypothetical protein